ncbi:MAG: EAL domain-containing protein [Thiobacillaceae bacterium]
MKRFNTLSLQSRIFLFFFLLILLTQIGSAIITSTLALRIVNRQITGDVETAQRVFVQMFEQNTRLLSQGARVLASDYGFREAVASNDRDTLSSALENNGERIQADLMSFVSKQGTVITYARGHTTTLPGPNHQWLLDPKSKNQAGYVIKQIDGVLYQLIAAPVAIPLPVGWVVTGFRIDDAFAKKIARITNTEVSFANHDGGSNWHVPATTLSGEAQGALSRALNDGKLTTHSLAEVHTKTDDYLSSPTKLASTTGKTALVILQKSRTAELAPFLTLRDRLLALGLLGLALSAVVSMIISRSVTRPIHALAGYARNIAEGDFSITPVTSSQTEISDLAKAFDHMRREISVREANILELAYQDVLTKLPNRAMFHDRMQQALHHSRRTGQPMTVMLMDLDRFKYVNDSLGHHIGDLLLQEVAGRLNHMLQRGTDTIARLGGDEFAILLPTDNLDSARKLARSLLTALEKPMMVESQIIDIRGSIGLASSPEHGIDIETLMRCADVAMYQAKRSNSGVSAYDARLDQNTRERLSLMSELCQAVEHNHLTLFYQPKVDFKDDSYFSVEALVRWIHPERGMVPPNDFIPFAEQTGYIKAITHWVLNEGLRQCAEWDRHGLHVNVSINISARDLMNPELPTYFSDLLQLHGCQAERICLEITESAILDDPGHALENLQRMKALGCKLSVDDYGTGYSSLAYLRKLPVSELKIDRSFVQNMANDASDIVIVRSTIDLAHNLGLRVVAEGVETEAALKQLFLLGCDQVQGYLLSKPISADDFEHWASRLGWEDQIKTAREA